MRKTIVINTAVAALIPIGQLRVTEYNPEAFADSLEQLEATLNSCPNIGETDGMYTQPRNGETKVPLLKEHPAMFHYFYGGSDIFICEYDRKDVMFGFAIFGDVQESEFGYFRLSDLTAAPLLNIDYHFEEQTIEAARYKMYPKYFKNPKSLKQ
jgi:hypothetical protein